ncbi:MULTISPECIES: hypothetical protein [Enterobacter]|uniref:hypothetical protein n=1 Tax=Enterobacter TaxID=547 RepID=UPI0018888D9A|nr:MULTISPECIES: hypothetical protein [Enterobacter]MBF2790034.1 hypothetical protein [Enterobacter asburiae]
MDVTATESTMKNVMDLYYSWLIQMLGPKGNDKIALLSTIVTHDIIKDAPLYTNYVFRQFADRTVSVSPEDFGAGNTNDRYSRVYRQIIDIAASELYAKATLTSKQQQDIDYFSGNITEAVEEIKSIRQESNRNWQEYAKQAGLQPGTPSYELERAKYYQPYISLIKDQRQKIITAQAKKKAIWLSVFKNDIPGRELAEVYERTIAEDNQQALPTDINIETKYGLDPITIGAAADSGIFAFETELGLLPSGTLTKILDMKGVRGETFKHDVKETHNHDSEWHGNASGGWGLWHANANASEEHHFRQSLQNLESISISCDFMGEYWVGRRDWFSSTILNNKYVVEALKKNPSYSYRLALCISSMIIVRGLKVKYKFKKVEDTAIWSSYNYSGGGGYGAFGVDFGSVSGGTSGNSYDHIVDTTENSVTFFDGNDVCRLIALRVSPIIDIDLNKIAFEMKLLDQSTLGLELIELWRNKGSFTILSSIKKS